MNVTISKARPVTKPIREYDTRFIYVGFKYRYDTQSKMLSSIEKHSDGHFTYSETPSDTDVFSRGYSSENVRVLVYSENPRVWVEELSPHDYFVFAQQPRQAACT